MLLKNTESIVALITVGMCQFCSYPFPLIISVPRLQGGEGSCLFKFPPIFTSIME